MGISICALIASLLFQVGPTAEEARNEILLYHNRVFNQIIESAKTGKVGDLCDFDMDLDTTTFKKVIKKGINEKGLSRVINELEKSRDGVLDQIRDARIREKTNSVVLYPPSGDSCEFNFCNYVGERWKISMINYFRGKIVFVRNYFTEEENREIRGEMVKEMKGYDLSKYGEGAEEHEGEQIEEEQIDTKYTTIAYYDVGEWANAGDLELLVSSYSIKREKFFGGRYSKDYMGWMMYVNMKIKNVSDGNFFFYPKEVEISLSDGTTAHYDEDKAYSLGLGSASIPPYVTITRVFPFNIVNCSGLYASIVMPKLKRTSDTGYEVTDGNTYINLGELPPNIDLNH
ncbi:MAG: hypothetical protein IB618_01280 [Candidatus Pacearchaeota archaeon]|nr:MAG: hypothetical protein IB618_01280 [Candidatus Pacearchaeota archaeon]